MNGTNLVCIDIETGGLDYKNNQLLTIGVVLKKYIKDNSQVKGFELKLTRDKTKTVTEEALIVNGINLEEHDEETVSFESAKMIIEKEVHDFFDGEKPSFVLGHNVGFDINWLQNTLFTKAEWDEIFGYRVLDTASVGLFLKFSNFIETNKGSLTALMNCFGINVDEGKRHTGLGDCFYTVELFEEMSKYISSIKDSNEELKKSLEYYE
ncbi:MAG: 3'-5' exonuclease [Paraclostridium sp.]